MICTYSETDYALNVLRSERRDRGLSEPVPLSLEIAEKKPEIQLGESFTQMLNRLIEAAEEHGFLPLCVAFDRNGIESRGEDSIRELEPVT